MGGLFPADTSGLLWTVMGLIVLILFGVGVTLMTDGNFSFGQERTSPAGKLAGLKAEIVRLDTERKSLESRLELRRGWTSGRKDLERRAEEVAAAVTLLADLREEELEEEAALKQVRADFASYRTNFRRKLWEQAVGKRIDNLQTRGGKTYRDVTIRGLSIQELKISHQAGSATIPIAELLPGFLTDYHLDPAEAQREIDEELARERERIARLQARRREEAEREMELAEKREARASSRRSSREKEEDEHDEEDSEKAEKIALLRLEVAKLSARVNTLAMQGAEARTRAVSGGQRSPPGSLETWPQRASRLAGLEGKARAQLNVVEDRLRALDPRYRSPRGR